MRAAGGFPVYVIEMVEIGQKTGHLEDVFRSLAGYYERLEQLQKSIRNAVVYPSVLLVMMLFQEVFQQLGAELSPAAQALMQLGQFLGRYGLVVLAVLVLALLIGGSLLRNEQRKAAFVQWLQQKSEKWTISKLIASSRLADALAMTLSSGYLRRCIAG